MPAFMAEPTFIFVVIGIATILLMLLAWSMVSNYRKQQQLHALTRGGFGAYNLVSQSFSKIKRKRSEHLVLQAAAKLAMEGKGAEAVVYLYENYSLGAPLLEKCITDLEKAGVSIAPDAIVRLRAVYSENPESVMAEVSHGTYRTGRVPVPTFLVEVESSAGGIEQYFLLTGARIERAEFQEQVSLETPTLRVITERRLTLNVVASDLRVDLDEVQRVFSEYDLPVSHGKAFVPAGTHFYMFERGRFAVGNLHVPVAASPFFKSSFFARRTRQSEHATGKAEAVAAA